MFRKALLFAMAVMAVFALSAPVASAVWTHNGEYIGAGTNPRVWFTGQLSYTSAVVGGADCQVKGTLELTGGTTTALVTTFDVDLTTLGATATEKCVMSGPIAPCRTKEVVPTGIPWTVHSSKPDVLSVTTGEIDYVFESQSGGACGVLQQHKLKAGTLTATIAAGKTSAIEELTLSGELQTQTGSKVAVGGKQGLTPAATYGTSEC